MGLFFWFVITVGLNSDTLSTNTEQRETIMEEKKHTEGWVWVIVNDQAGGGHYLGLHSEESDLDFIPAFVSKQAAGDCFLTLPRQKGQKYEIQAVHLDELTVDAEKNGFAVALVDGEGNIVDHNGENV